MKKFSWTIFAVLVVFACQVPARADTVELDLFGIGCQHTYDINSPYWQTDFNLGVTFTEISHVYIDWSGGITAGLAIDYDNPNEPFPEEVGIYASLGFPRRTEVWGGRQRIHSRSRSTACPELRQAQQLGLTCSMARVLSVCSTMR